jgi:hypothetical protein
MKTLTEVSNDECTVPSESLPKFFPEEVDPKKHLVSKNEYTVPGPSPSNFFPEGISLSGEEFDPKKHLQLEPPTHIKDMTFKTVPFPFDAKQRAINGIHSTLSRSFR